MGPWAGIFLDLWLVCLAVISVYPFVRSIWFSDHWQPPEAVKMTSDERWDDVWWRAYVGTSQRKHDHQCSKSLPWAALLYIRPLVLAAN
jgi:hypothetical protein